MRMRNKRYLVDIGYKDGSAENDLVDGFYESCQMAEKPH